MGLIPGISACLVRARRTIQGFGESPRIERGGSAHLDVIYAHLGGKHRAVTQHGDSDTQVDLWQGKWKCLFHKYFYRSEGIGNHVSAQCFLVLIPGSFRMTSLWISPSPAPPALLLLPCGLHPSM